ncbi:MAG: phospholipase [Chitinophagaceae bacterium]|nr:phospholipase [Chitinophagaceae bacterium]
MKSEGYSNQNQVMLVNGGRDYFDRLHQMIREARYCIWLQFYIFMDDETGLAVADLLMQAVRRKVSVYLLVDGYASQGLSKEAISKLQNAGVQFKWFEPLFKSRKFYLGRRMHHKLVVIDGLYAMAGGINISNRYNDMPDSPAWMDRALYCEGSEVQKMLQVCKQLWNRDQVYEWENQVNQLIQKKSTTGTQEVRVRRNDWVKRKNEVTRSYLAMLLYAREEIIIMCSYFLPGRVFRREITNAIKRGVKIRLILAGHSDVMVAKHAERYLYHWLLKKGAFIYEYQPTILHAKMAVCDTGFVTVGSYNVNNISAYASLELNIDVQDNNFASQTKQKLEEIISKDCKEVTKHNWRARPGFFLWIWQRLCYLFIKTVLRLFTFYFKQEE